MSLRGTSHETQECVAASRKRPDKDSQIRQEVFRSEKEDAQPSWYHNGIWKLPTLRTEQVAELADDNEFIFLTWSSYKVVLVVCLLPLIPDHVHFAATSDTPSLCVL